LRTHGCGHPLPPPSSAGHPVPKASRWSAFQGNARTQSASSTATSNITSNEIRHSHQRPLSPSSHPADDHLRDSHGRSPPKPAAPPAQIANPPTSRSPSPLSVARFIRRPSVGLLWQGAACWGTAMPCPPLFPRFFRKAPEGRAHNLAQRRKRLGFGTQKRSSAVGRGTTPFDSRAAITSGLSDFL